MVGKSVYPNPQFKSVEEEDAYWQRHDPLTEDYKGKWQRRRQKLSSYFALRLTGEEITRLRNAATKKDLTISAYARGVLMAAVEKEERPAKPLTTDDLAELLGQGIPESVAERMLSLVKEMATGSPSKPTLLVIDTPQVKEWEEIAKLLIPLLLSLVGARVVSPEKKQYPVLRDMVKS